MRAGLYVRISRDREGTEVGIDRQEKDCRKLAKERGWEVVEVYSDNDLSASSGRPRPAFRQMLADLKEGRLDAIVAYSSSRFYRKARDLEALIDLLNKKRADVATVASGTIDLATADGRMLARMLASIDQGEAERIGERSRRAKADLKARGTWLGGGAPPYGYERVKDDRGKVTEHRVVETEASILREVATRVLDGESVTRLSAELNRRGVSTSLGYRWTPSKLRATLTSPFHAGRFPDGKSGSWPAIFSADEATLLRARFPKPEPQRDKETGETQWGRPGGRRYALSGLLVCSECGSKLLGSAGLYRCQARNGGCGKVRIRSWPVDELVGTETWARTDVMLAQDKVRRPRTADPEPLLAEIRAGEAKLLELRDAYAADAISLDDFREMRAAVGRRIMAAEDRIRELAPPPPTRSRGWLAKLDEPDEFSERWERRELTAEEVADLNDFFRRWIEKVVVSPARRRGRPPKDAPSDVPDRVTIAWR